jgi:sialidase-1
MRKLFLFISILSTGFLHAQKISGEKISNWKGFEKAAFNLDSFSAYYIRPQKPVDGNPWVLRAYFPDWHTDIDSILLSRGFYIAYINTSNLYGQAKAMMAWDQFYDYLTTQKHFASKVGLEGVSRGGLYIYGWAKRNPTKVSCIYAEAPVCDFTSWPGGRGKGVGSAREWKKLLNIYGFSEEQALKFDDQPIDNLQALASFKVPILHAVGLKDSIVPPGENSFILVNNYIRYGGPATVVPMTRGKQELQGHHFEIENPQTIADFIYRNNVPVAQTLSAESFIHAYGNLDNALYRIQKEQKATVAFLGGSITHMNGWRNNVMQYLQELFPQTQFTFLNAGIPSLGSVPHAFRLQRDVLNKGRIDLMFIESAVNDHVNGTTEIEQRRALEGIIRHAYASNPYMNMIMMAFVDEDKINDYNNGKIPLEVQVHDQLAERYHLPFINLAEEVSRRIANKEFTWEYDFKSLHPSPFGMEIYFNTMKTLLRKEWIDKSPVQSTKVIMPAPLQKLNYADADYVSVDKAIDKKDFEVNPSWHPDDGARTREGFVDVPMLVGEKAGASFDFHFKGTTVGVAVVSGPDAGIIHYSVDGKNEKELDTYNHYSKSLHLPQYFLLADGLKNQKHLLHVKILEQHNKESKGMALRIVYFLVNK